MIKLQQVCLLRFLCLHVAKTKKLFPMEIMRYLLWMTRLSPATLRFEILIVRVIDFVFVWGSRGTRWSCCCLWFYLIWLFSICMMQSWELTELLSSFVFAIYTLHDTGVWLVVDYRLTHEVTFQLNLFDYRLGYISVEFVTRSRFCFDIFEMEFENFQSYFFWQSDGTLPLIIGPSLWSLQLIVNSWERTVLISLRQWMRIPKRLDHSSRTHVVARL